MRNFEHNFAWLADLPAGITVDVIVATWAERGVKMFGDLRSERIRTMFPDYVSDALPPSWVGPRLFDYLPGLRASALASGQASRITVQAVQAALPCATVHIEERLAFAWFEKDFTGSDPFSLQMLYKVWQADLLRRNSEAANGTLYDAVIRARPDRPLSGIDWNLVQDLGPGKIYVEAVNARAAFLGDQFAIADSATMTVYGDFFFDAYIRARGHVWPDVHHALWDYAQSKGLQALEYNPMLSFAPEQVLTVNDLCDAIGYVPAAAPVSGGWRPASALEASTLISSVLVTSSLHSGRIALDGPELRAYVEALLADYMPDRDVGFFYMLVAGHGASLDLYTRMLCACLMAQSVPDPRALQAAHSYSFHFSIVIEQFARAHGVSPLDPAGILQLALSDIGSRHQIHAPLARFLAQPAQADVACAALATLLGNLRQLDPGLWLRLIRPLSAAARWQDALAALRSVHAAHPRDPQVCQELAVILCRSGHAEEAIRTMKQAVELEPRHPYVLANAANLMLEAGALVDAAAFAQRAADIEPSVAAFRDLLVASRQAIARQANASPHERGGPGPPPRPRYAEP